MLSTKHWLPLVLILLALTHAPAQNIYMRRILPEKGIRAYEVYSVFQDSRHYIWFATDGGVWRYDGREYTSYTTAEGLPDNVVFGFFEDDKQRLWLRSYSNRIAYIKDGSVVTLPCSEKLSHLKKNALTSTLLVDHDTVYITYQSYGSIVKIAPPYREQDLDVFETGNKTCSYIYEVSKNKIAVGAFGVTGNYSKDITLIRKDTTLVIPMPDNYNGQSIAGCWQQKDNSHLVAIGNALYRYKDGNIQLQLALNHNILHAMYDNSGNLWIATLDGGLFVYRKDSLLNDPGVYFRNEVANSVIQDAEGSYWITTLKNGIYYAPFNDLTLLNSSNGLHESMTCTYFDSASGKLYCFGEGYLATVKEDSVQTAASISFRQREPNNIYTVIPLGGSSLLCLGRQSFLYNTGTAKAEPVKHYTNKILTSRAGCVLGDTVLCSIHTHLLLYSRQNNTTSFYDRFDHKINCIYPFNRDHILVATEGGLYLYNVRTRVKARVPGFREGVSIIGIEKMKKGSSKFIVVAKAGDVCVIDENLQQISEARSKGYGISVRNIYLDEDDILWMSTNRGIYRLDKELHASVIDKEHGLPSDLINHIACANGRIIASSEAGLVIFPQSRSFFNSYSPDLYCTGISVNDSLVEMIPAYELSYDKNFIKIAWQALNYRVNGDVTCRYKMDGIDSSWHSTANSIIEYTTLPPGDYSFEMYAVNNDGVKSRSMIRFKFHISPPYWETWWFYSLVFVLGSTFTASAVMIRIRQVAKREKEKMELTRKSEKAEMQALRSQMNPHFIFNSINSIQHHILIHEPLTANMHLTRFSKLMRNILEQSRQELITIGREVETLNLYLEMESLRFEDKFSYAIDIHPGIDPSLVRIPPLIVQPFIENAIWHGLLLKEGEKKVSIGFYPKDDDLIIEVDDNGIGRKAASDYSRKRTGKESLGIKITTERLELLEKMLNVRTSLSLIDKYTPDGEPGGTKVIIQLTEIKHAYDKSRDHR